MKNDKHTPTHSGKKHSSNRRLRLLTVCVCLLALLIVSVTAILLLQYFSLLPLPVNTAQVPDGSEASEVSEVSTFGNPDPVSVSAAAEVTPTASPVPDSDSEVSAPEPEKSIFEQELPAESQPTFTQAIDFDALHQTNQDIYAWVNVPNTTVDYPILQTETDNYYLMCNLDGSYGYPGCIYTNASCNNHEFTDYITIAYGHNMPQGTMFTTLENLEDQATFDETTSFTVYTEQNRFTYELVAAVWYSDDYIPYYYDTASGQGVLDFWNSILTGCDFVNEASHLREGVEITAEDKLCVLSTCCRQNGSIVSGRRYLVVGRLAETAVCE